MYTYQQLLEDSVSKYTSHGCYPKYWVCKDGGILSYEAVKENLNQIKDAMTGESLDSQWEIIGCEVNWENEELICSHTGKRIEVAYV